MSQRAAARRGQWFGKRFGAACFGAWLGALALLLGALACQAIAPPAPPEPLSALRAVDPWVRAVPPVSRMTAAYLRIENAGEADRLIAASASAASSVALHETVREGEGDSERVSMQPRAHFDIPARGAFALAPEGAHLMLRGYQAPADGRVTLTLEFASGRRLVVDAPVERR